MHKHQRDCHYGKLRLNMVKKRKNKGVENNYQDNVPLALDLVRDELNYEEKRYEYLTNKCATYIGFTSILLALLFDDALQKSLKGYILTISNLTIFNVGLFFISISIILSLYAYRIKLTQRPNMDINNGLLKNEIMECDENSFKQTTIKHILTIIKKNEKLNNNTGVVLRYVICLLIIGIVLISISFIFR